MRNSLCIILGLCMLFFLTNCEEDEKQYRLTLSTNLENSGTVSGDGEYTAGDEISLAATSNEGFSFLNWTEGTTIVSTTANFSYTIPSRNVSLTANFLNVYVLTLSVDPANSGIVNGSGDHNVGEEVNISATPNSGYSFVNWTQGETIISTDPNFNYTIPSENVTLTAHFIKKSKLTIAMNLANSGVVSCSGEYSVGEEVYITATPNHGYSFVNWTLEETIVSTDQNFTFTIPAEDVTLTANFIGNGSITLQPNATEGKDALIASLSPDNNYGTHPDFAAMAWTNNFAPTNVRGLIQFDFSSVPANAIIQSVTLTLYGYNSASNGTHSTLSGSNESVLQRITESWDESTVTWNNQPATTTVNQVVLPTSTSDTQNYTIDITESAKYMIENPSYNFGYMLKLVTESYYRSMLFASSDCSYNDLHPKLVINYSFKK
ncbi:MAG: DNRLRE domain-containing protein [Bacteroidales bacterium]